MPVSDIEETSLGNLMVNKERAISNIESRLLGSSPRTRNNMLLRRGHQTVTTGLKQKEFMIEPVLPS